VATDPGTGTKAVRHAGGLYRKTASGIASPFKKAEQKVESEAHHLHDVEQAGESGETPYIAILGLFLFLVPIVILLLVLAFGAYYLAK